MIVSSIRRFDSEFLAGVRQFTSELAGLEKTIPADVLPQAGDALHQRVLRAFEASQTVCRELEMRLDDEDQLLAAQDYFRTATDPWMRKSWYSNRAREKPSGFSGDYEMLIKLYERKTPARGLGGYLDMCLQDLPLSCAVRARLAAARQFLLDERQRHKQSLRILDIASGPCREFLNWPLESSSEIVALDNDPGAIDYVRQTVVPQLPNGTRLQVHRYNALRTRNASATIKKFGTFDIIYSVGLFDYLSDRHLIDILNGLRDTLNPEGVLYIAFKDARQYDKTPYQWHLDWFFFQRTYEDVLDLYRQAGFDVDAIETSRDETGIIVNVISRPVRNRIERLDAAATPLHGPKPQPSEGTQTNR